MRTEAFHTKVRRIQLGAFVENFLPDLGLFQIRVVSNWIQDVLSTDMMEEDQVARRNGYLPDNDKQPWIDVEKTWADMSKRSSTVLLQSKYWELATRSRPTSGWRSGAG